MARQGKQSGRVSLDAAFDLRPLRQGELDGLCGVYAAVNALRMLLAAKRPLSPSEIDTMFHEGLRVLDKRDELGWAVNYGVSKSSWVRMVRKMAAAAEATTGLPVMQRLPFAEQRRPSRQQLFEVIEAAIGREHPVLIALSGRHSHYTVVCGYSPTRLMLFDSNALRWLDRTCCGPRHAESDYRHRIATRSLTVLELAPC